MIISNGTIEFKTKTGISRDQNTGYALQPSSEWSKPMECQYYQNHSNLQARAGTEATNSVSYTILIEGEAKGERLRLKAKDGSTIGEFSTRSIEKLRAVGQTKIIV